MCLTMFQSIAFLQQLWGSSCHCLRLAVEETKAPSPFSDLVPLWVEPRYRGRQPRPRAHPLFPYPGLLFFVSLRTYCFLKERKSKELLPVVSSIPSSIQERMIWGLAGRTPLRLSRPPVLHSSPSAASRPLCSSTCV